MSDIVPMPSTRIKAGRYLVLGTNTECIVQVGRLDESHEPLWNLYSNGKYVRCFFTKREALQYCQEHSEL